MGNRGSVPIGLIHDEVLKIAPKTLRVSNCRVTWGKLRIQKHRTSDDLQAETLRLLQMVQEPTRSRNHHMRLLAQRNSLLHHIHAAKNQGAPEGNQGAERLKSL